MQSMTTLRRLGTGLDISLDDEAFERFEQFKNLLLDWNSRTNLTRITDPEEIQVKLFGDALGLIPWINRFVKTLGSDQRPRLIDVGAGAGFPGLPLKIAMPNIEMVLIEATGKKVAFVNAAIAELGLTRISAIHGRSEELARDPMLRGRFDVVTARALARLPALLELCLPFLRPGGIGLFPKGRDARTEVEEAVNALKALNAEFVALQPSTLPEYAGSNLVIVRQRSRIPAQFPRRVGVPTRSPL